MSAVPSAAETYQNEGYVLFRKVLDPALIGEANTHVDWLLKKHPDHRPEHLHHYLCQKDPFWIRLVSDDRLLDIAQQFIGPNIALFGTHYICKPPHTGQAVLWHQDGSNQEREFTTKSRRTRRRLFLQKGTKVTELGSVTL